MSDIESAIEAALRADDRVTSLIGSITGVRIFQQKLAQGSLLPALTYQLVDDPSESSHTGPSGLAHARIQFDCWGNTKEEAAAVARAVRLALGGIRREVLGVFIQSGLKLTERTLFDPDVRLRRRSLDMSFWHSEER